MTENNVIVHRKENKATLNNLPLLLKEQTSFVFLYILLKFIRDGRLIYFVLLTEKE